MTHCNVKRLTPTARMPERGSPQAAGMDVRADLLDAEGEMRTIRTSSGERTCHRKDGAADGAPCFRLWPGERALVPTGISMATSTDVYTRVAPRSGLALKHGIDVLAGVVDADYSGEVGVLLINTDGERGIVIEHGMRVAQLVLERVAIVDPVEVGDLESTERGASGFGSTGTA